MKPLLVIILVLGISASIFFGYKFYHKTQSANIDTEKRTGNEEGKIPESGDLCGGTGGIGQIISTGKNTFSLKRKDGSTLIVMLTNQATIKTPAGKASLSDLKIGNRVTLVGDMNPNGRFTAEMVLVCN